MRWKVIRETRLGYDCRCPICHKTVRFGKREKWYEHCPRCGTRLMDAKKIRDEEITWW